MARWNDVHALLVLLVAPYMVGLVSARGRSISEVVKPGSIGGGRTPTRASSVPAPGRLADHASRASQRNASRITPAHVAATLAVVMLPVVLKKAHDAVRDSSRRRGRPRSLWPVPRRMSWKNVVFGLPAVAFPVAWWVAIRPRRQRQMRKHVPLPHLHQRGGRTNSQAALFVLICTFAFLFIIGLACVACSERSSRSPSLSDDHPLRLSCHDVLRPDQ
ncbi:Uncharacterized protein PBTT_03764 [Plasmodiophora brassicae]|uniref:Uncharacterized protein n=1 Tax=Plasmodiophora brassicae TaxID=37360 RepID=A0A0G4IS13_PLABS|nr:hypothetical protein PBRA_006242 [Plasmodiophora brassicae]SPQ96052.1 unnamed protein product [Plasmodiophora brassicae]